MAHLAHKRVSPKQFIDTMHAWESEIGTARISALIETKLPEISIVLLAASDNATLASARHTILTLLENSHPDLVENINNH